MTCAPYSQLVRYKQWADRELHEVIGRNLGRLSTEDASILLRILDHIHAVDSIFQHHLQGLPHSFKAPQSEKLPEFHTLVSSASAIDDWYVSYVDGLTKSDLEQPLDFVFTSGKPAHMRRGEIILHVCLHGTYHRGNAGIVLKKNGIDPGGDRLTDFLETMA